MKIEDKNKATIRAFREIIEKSIKK